MFPWLYKYLFSYFEDSEYFVVLIVIEASCNTRGIYSTVNNIYETNSSFIAIVFISGSHTCSQGTVKLQKSVPKSLSASISIYNRKNQFVPADNWILQLFDWRLKKEKCCDICSSFFLKFLNRRYQDLLKNVLFYFSSVRPRWIVVIVVWKRLKISGNYFYYFFFI